MTNTLKPTKLMESLLLRTGLIKMCLLENICKKMPESGRTLWMRTLFSLLLISYFCLVIYLGPIAVMASTLVIQVNCFFELIGIAHRIYQTPRFNLISCYFLTAANYFFYGENLMEHFNVFFEDIDYLTHVITYHRFISFLLYLVGVVWFILPLKKNKDHGKKEFALLGWTHFALLLIVCQSYMVVKVIFQGLIWVILLVTCVSCNDVMAYVCGKLFGKTPLIQVSPNKTWEGFVGGGIFTMIYTITMSPILCQYDYFVCPIEYKRRPNGEVVMLTQCDHNSIFHVKRYGFSIDLFGIITARLGLKIYPFIVHAFWLSLFSSVIAPFAGFFASGFKRAFKVKDFGCVIPGHGGILDRCDCQILMATFVNVYITSFIKTYSVDKIFTRILAMKNDDQIMFFNMYEDMLVKNGLNVTKN